MTYNKQRLVEDVAVKAGITKGDAHDVVDAVLDSIMNAVGRGEKVQIVDFGSFVSRKRAARRGRNPQTGGEITIPETIVPAFKAGKGFKDVVRK